MEAQISAISDDIAYNNHDIEDGLRANLYKIEDLKNIPILSDVIEKHKKFIKIKGTELVLRQVIREIINVMVTDVIVNTKKNIKEKKIKNINDVYKNKNSLVTFSKEMNFFDSTIKSFLRERMYFSKDVLKKTNMGKKIIQFLFLKIKKNPSKFIKKNIYQKIIANDNEWYCRHDRSICNKIIQVLKMNIFEIYLKKIQKLIIAN